MATKTGSGSKTKTKTKTGSKTETIQPNPKRASGKLPCYRRFEDEREEIAKGRRRGRKTKAGLFRDEYFYCKCLDTKTCVWEGDWVTDCSWKDESCGITWAGVHGKDSICVVTKTGDLDVSRVHGYLIFEIADNVFRNFRRAVISELEDLADPSSELRKSLDESMKRSQNNKSIKMPFGVVSVAPLPNNVHKASCVYEDTKFTKLMVEGLIKEMEGASISDESEIESDFDEDDEDEVIKYLVKKRRRSWRDTPGFDTPYGDEQKTVREIQKEMENEETKRAAALGPSDDCDDERAVTFLKDAMRSIEDFSLEVTVKTAISAFQRLFNKNFNADDIQVSVMDPEYSVLASEDQIKDIYVKHLESVEIEKYLSDISMDQADEELRSNVKQRYHVKQRHHLRLLGPDP